MNICNNVLASVLLFGLVGCGTNCGVLDVRAAIRKRMSEFKTLFLMAVGLSVLSTMMGCSNYSSTQRIFKNQKIAARITPISDANYEKKSKTFKIRSVTLDAGSIKENADFEKTKTLFVPLLFFNYWDHQTKYSIGKGQFNDSLEKYVKNAFEVGIEQYGYEINDTAPDILIDIKARKIKSSALYSKKGHFLFALYFWEFGTSGSKGPYSTDLFFDITIQCDGRIVTADIQGTALLERVAFR